MGDSILKFKYLRIEKCKSPCTDYPADNIIITCLVLTTTNTDTTYHHLVRTVLCHSTTLVYRRALGNRRNKPMMKHYGSREYIDLHDG